MYSERHISAAFVQMAHPNEGEIKRAAERLVYLMGTAFFIDSENWLQGDQPVLAPLVIEGTQYEVLPIEMDVDPAQVSWNFDIGTFQFYLVKPVDPRSDIMSAKVAIRRQYRGAEVREFASLRELHSSTLRTLYGHILRQAPRPYQNETEKLMNKMTGVGEAYHQMFS